MMAENDEIERIQRQIGVYDLALAAGVQLKKIGANEYAGLCPFHEDKNPSLHINPIKNTFHCKGCGKAGSPIDWIVHERQVKVGEAIKILKAKLPQLWEKVAGSPLAEVRPAVDLARPELQNALRVAVDYYHKTLREQQAPIEYLTLS